MPWALGESAVRYGKAIASGVSFALAALLVAGWMMTTGPDAAALGEGFGIVGQVVLGTDRGPDWNEAR